MANAYSTPTTFKAWMPQRYLAELSNDTNGFEADDAKLQEALDKAASLMESKLMVRDDIPIPAINSDDSVPNEIQECVYDLAIYMLMKRRATMTDTIMEGFNIQMTWLNDVVSRKANIAIFQDNVEKTKTTEKILYGGKNKKVYNQFDNFSF